MTKTTSDTARLAATLALAAFLFSSTSLAGGTRLWELAGYAELDKGELENTSVSARGEVTVGLQPAAIDLEDLGMVWSGVPDKAGAIYLGTGYDGRIFRVDGGKATLIATTKQLVITSMAFDGKGDLYASSLPDAVIWRIPAPGKIKAGAPVEAERWATLPAEAKHVWALAFDEEGVDLFAGTGPEGKIFAVGRDAKASVYMDTEEEHVLSLCARDGRLLAGTSPGALLLELSGPGRATSLADFDSTEVKAIARDGKRLVLAVNSFGSPPSIPTKPAAPPTPPGTPANTGKTPKLGSGAVHVLLQTGQLEQIWSSDKSHILSLAVDGAGKIYAGLASEGKIVSVDGGRVERTEADLDEREVMVLIAGESLTFAATGDAGAAYAISAARAAEAFYLSPPLDAGTTARWGKLTWFAEGIVSVEARSGNTLTPDRSWSDWSKPVQSGKAVDRPPARYLQLRASWARDPKAIFRSAQLAYAPMNRRAVVTELNPDSPFFEAGKDAKGKSKKDKEALPSRRTIATRPAKKNPMELEISWKVDNPDDDTLRYRLWYRAIGEKLWRPILREDEVLTKTRHKWATESVPEGQYVIRLLADDSPDNDPAEALSDEYVSVPVLVDNHQPAVTGLAYKGGRLKGEARDSFSEISALEFSVDAGPWMPMSCADRIFDQPSERFDLPLPVELAPGPHAIAVRAYDRAGNTGTAEIHVEER